MKTRLVSSCPRDVIFVGADDWGENKVSVAYDQCVWKLVCIHKSEWCKLHWVMADNVTVWRKWTYLNLQCFSFTDYVKGLKVKKYVVVTQNTKVHPIIITQLLSSCRCFTAQVTCAFMTARPKRAPTGKRSHLCPTWFWSAIQSRTPPTLRSLWTPRPSSAATRWTWSSRTVMRG